MAVIDGGKEWKKESREVKDIKRWGDGGGWREDAVISIITSTRNVRRSRVIVDYAICGPVSSFRNSFKSTY